MAIDVKDPAIAGLVLTSSIVRHAMPCHAMPCHAMPCHATPEAVQHQDLKAIQVPVLVCHHARDACRLRPPLETEKILEGLGRAPVKKRMMVDGGADPGGDACDARHWHGFIGMEREAVDQIAGWIRNPAG
jgi:pimeloyl-ACP methyl ester carboxylesterase